MCSNQDNKRIYISGENIEQDSSLKERINLWQEAQNKGQAWDIIKWQDYLNSINQEAMELGLKRVNEVAHRLKIFKDILLSTPYIITVAGTNGKGSSSALIAAMAKNLGFKVGLFTSPHLITLNERIKIDGINIDDKLFSECLYEVICAQHPHNNIESIHQESELDEFNYDVPLEIDNSEEIEGNLQQAFQAINNYQGPYHNKIVDLSYFEILTLAAMRAFMRQGCEIIVLEVGLGGRLDACNIFPNDIALITSIGLDHMAILGDNTVKIAYEKAGIIKEYTKVILGANMDTAAKNEILRCAKLKSCSVSIENIDFSAHIVPKDQSYPQYNAEGLELCYSDKALHSKLYLPYPKVPFACASLALHTIFLILKDLTKTYDDFASLNAIAQALNTVALPGRMQLVAHNPHIYLDVAHNAPAAEYLVKNLPLLDKNNYAHAKRIAIVGMLKDKEIEKVMAILAQYFATFILVPLDGVRGEKSERLEQALQACNYQGNIILASSVSKALNIAKSEAKICDHIMVLGSFVTVANALNALEYNEAE